MVNSIPMPAPTGQSDAAGAAVTTSARTGSRRLADRIFRPEKGSGIRDSNGYRVFRVVNGVLLIAICFLTLYPFLNVIAQAFSSEAYINSGQVNLIPQGFNVTTFGYVLGDPMFWRNYGNTVVYTVVATAIAMVLTTTFAYALSKKHLKGRVFFIGVAVFTMFFNGGLIPNYILINTLGMKNTLWAIVLPNAISVFNLLVMKAFFENFPEDLEEAAGIDGLTTYGILLRIVLPLSKAVIATMVLFYAVSFWNSWFAAFLYMDKAELYPVTVYLRNLIAAATGTESIGAGQSSGDSVQVAANVKAVTMLLTVLPIIALYPFIQKYFVSGVMLGSVKQ
ncbi:MULTISPECIES: carbohydrate ABC transporter permease [unclassified Microbacterium]|uniref:carbohydrate ABC transporter permease n=1 Tax=unclassified Microbacterium TaxID=2609290 RepID=UPI0030188B79